MLDRSWPLERQFVRDRGQPSPYGLLEAYYVAKDPEGHTIECAADLDYAPTPDEAGHALASDFQAATLDDFVRGQAVRQRVPAGQLCGVQFLCPRCGSPLYVPALAHPHPKTTPRRITVHWDKPMTAERDGVSRPTVTIEGDPLACDYLWSEVTGISSGPIGAQRCGWIGIMEKGRLYEHGRKLSDQCRPGGDLHVRG